MQRTLGCLALDRKLDLARSSAEEAGAQNSCIEPSETICLDLSDKQSSPHSYLFASAGMQVLLQMANGGTPDDGTNLSSSPSMEVVAILQESAERLNLFTSQVALRKERDDAHRIAQVSFCIQYS